MYQSASNDGSSRAWTSRAPLSGSHLYEPALYGVDYRRIPAAKIIRYTSRTKIPQCGPERVRYQDVAENAFYCNAGRFVAYDDERLFPQLAREFGDFTIALTLAHEWGHAVQDQAGLTGPTIASNAPYMQWCLL